MMHIGEHLLHVLLQVVITLFLHVTFLIKDGHLAVTCSFSHNWSHSIFHSILTGFLFTHYTVVLTIYPTPQSDCCLQRIYHFLCLRWTFTNILKISFTSHSFLPYLLRYLLLMMSFTSHLIEMIIPSHSSDYLSALSSCGLVFSSDIPYKFSYIC